MEEKYDKFLTSIVKVMRSIRIYPPGHHVIEDDLEITFHVIEALLKSLPAVTITVRGEEILVDGKLVHGSFLKIKPLFREFDNKNIDSVTFLRGVSKDEIRLFIAILAKRSQEVLERDGINPRLMADIKHVKFNQIYYRPVSGDADRIKSAGGVGESGEIIDRVVNQVLNSEKTDSAEILGLVKENPSLFADIIVKVIHKVLPEGMDFKDEKAKRASMDYFERVASIIATEPNTSISNFKDSISTVLENLTPELQESFLGKKWEDVEPGDINAFLSHFSLKSRADIVAKELFTHKDVTPELKDAVNSMVSIDQEVVEFAELISKQVNESAHSEAEKKEYINKLFELIRTRKRHVEEEISLQELEGIIVIADEDISKHDVYAELFRYTHYQTIFCKNGKDALEMIKSKRPQLAILGVQISELSGLEAASALRNEGIMMPIIFCTNYPSYKDACEAQLYPEVRFFSKPVDGDDILNAVAELVPPKKIARELEDDMTHAAEVQKRLLPPGSLEIPGYKVSSYYNSSKEIGGDYYDFIHIDNDRLGIVIADVSGKSIPAAMLMVMVRSIFRMVSSQNRSARQIVISTNNIVTRDIKSGMFVSALYIILNTREHTLHICNAGHNPAILFRRKIRKVEVLEIPGMAMGVIDGPVFEDALKEEIINLEDGDTICLYTDGVTEAMNMEGKEFGIERLIDVINTNAEAEKEILLKSILKSVKTYQGSAPQHDDMVILLVGRGEM